MPRLRKPHRLAPHASPDWRVCAIVPTFDNPQTIGDVVSRVAGHVNEVFVVDDGSGPAGQAACEALTGTATVFRRPTNGGKGAAVKCGLRLAHDRGFSHALQVDADGQHDLDQIPALLEASRTSPGALVLASPRFDRSAPLGRRIGRLITTFWVRLESGREIDDAMCGFRVYPVPATLAVGAIGNAMDFDPEVAVRLVWNRTPVVNVPARVRYLSRGNGGVSHFRLFRDNLLLSWLHFRLTTRLVFSRVFAARRRASDNRRALGPGIRDAP